MRLVLIDGTPLKIWPTVSCFTRNCMITLLSGVICGATSKLKEDSLKEVDVAPLVLTSYYGISTPDSINAEALSRVMIAGFAST